MRKTKFLYLDWCGGMTNLSNDDGKAVEVNKFLSQNCRIQNIPFIDNSNIDERCHLNGSGLHLNYGGTCILANNFLNCIGF